MTNPKIVGLRKKIASVQKKFSGPRAPKGASLASRGFRGTQNASAIMESLYKMRSKHAVNNEYASKLVRIFESARKGEIVPPAGSPSSDHQILVNSARALFKAEKSNKVVELNKRQIEVLSKYHRMLYRRQ